ncbi:MAG: penicillin acylase family protein [Promethearchaeota archaeon]|nr:MAG: penicillin acylase family protein [Candidatus Lokiarchaeota archaeon]
MKKQEKVIVKKLIIVGFITGLTFSVFSLPIIEMLTGSPVAPLGNILFPGNGVWNVPGEVPEHETLYIEDLNDEVTVYRDVWGIPHIYGNDEEDLMFAAGYVHAQDRLFQMEMVRRLVRGRLSEIAGEEYIESDKYNLALGMEYWSKKTLLMLEEKEERGEIDLLEPFERYVDGINYYIDTHQNELPIEFAILGFKPTEWTMTDSLCFAKYMGYMLTWDYDDLYRLINFEALGSERYNDLYSQYAPYQIPICPNYGSYNDSVMALTHLESEPQPSSSALNAISRFLTNVENIESEKQLINIKKQNILGSNNWVVDGVLSDTGKPILCNDMHLAWGLPGIWYESHISAQDPDLNVYGFTLPGVPLVIVGHNEHIAWGFTNTNYDVLDWYYYNEIDSNHYIHNGKVKEYKTRDYKIRVKGKDPVEFKVKETVHGPVLNDFLDDAVPDSLDYENIVIAPQWTANDITYEALAFYEFFFAKNRAEFNESSRWFVNPAQNMIYGDIHGNIGIRPTGLVPIRDGNENGTFPYDGSSGEGEWIGYIPFEELPHTENPDQHYLASANQIVAGPNYKKYFLQHPYAAGYRARRINELLNNSEDGTVSVETMKEIQLDIRSTPAEYFTPYLINVIEKGGFSEKASVINQIYSHLKSWQFDMDKDKAAPTIYRKWRDLYMEYTFEDEFDALDAYQYVQLNVLEKLTREDPNSTWFDDIYTPIVEKRDDIILRAFLDTVDWLEDFYDSDDVDDWEWGDLHKGYFEHLLEIETFSKGPYELDGEGYTVNPSWVDISDGEGRAGGGASERMIIDFSDLQNCLSVIPSGQRGYSNSKHYDDQLELFLDGEYHPQYFYDDIEDFPESKIESQLHFIPAEKVIVWIAFTTIFLIIGIISLIEIRWIRKYDIIPKIEEKRNLLVQWIKKNELISKIKEKRNVLIQWIKKNGRISKIKEWNHSLVQWIKKR